jgi:hypothetical protein
MMKSRLAANALRLVALWVIGVLMLGTVAQAAQSGVFADNFSSGGYAGSSGSKPWSTPWVEQSDDGTPSGGTFQVVQHVDCSGPCLWVDGGPGLSGTSVMRAVDLSGAVDATLSFSYRRVSEEAVKGNAKLDVEISASGGAWETLLTIQLKSIDASRQWVSIPVAGWISADTSIRFLGRIGGSSVDLVVDDVNIEAAYPTTTTTATTTTTTIPGSTTTTTTTTVPDSTTTTTTTTIPGSTTTTTIPGSTTTTTTTTTTTVPDSTTTTTIPRSTITQPPQTTEDVTTDPPPPPSGSEDPPPDLSTVPRYMEKEDLVTLAEPATPTAVEHADYSVAPTTSLGAVMQSAARTLRTNLVSGAILGVFVAAVGLRGIADDSDEDDGDLA